MAVPSVSTSALPVPATVMLLVAAAAVLAVVVAVVVLAEVAVVVVEASAVAAAVPLTRLVVVSPSSRAPRSPSRRVATWCLDSGVSSTAHKRSGLCLGCMGCKKLVVLSSVGN